MAIDMSKYRDMFLSESREHLQTMGRLLVELEKCPDDREGLDALFREAHSIKGMAASMGYRATAELGHHLEDFLSGFRAGGAVPPAAIDRVLAGVDLLEGLIDDLTAERPERDVRPFIAGSAAAPPSAQQPAAPVPTAEGSEAVAPGNGAVTAPVASGEEVLKIAVELVSGAVAPAARALLMLRELAAQGEVLDADPDERQLLQGGAVPRLELRLKSWRAPQEIKDLLLAMPDVARVSCVVERLRPAARQSRERTVRVRTGLLDQFINLTGELVTNRYMLQAAYNEGRDRDMRDGLERLTRLITDLHHHVLQVRMMPLASITGRLPRMVRELEQQTGKEVALRIAGEEVELDRSILEALADPLMHLVRNAVDHGIEERGEVLVSASREKDLVLVEVRDNGRGLDAEEIRRKAVGAGLLSPGQALRMAERDLFPLICLPGFSTRTEVSETSGRGVGMDVVKAVTEQFGGTLQIASERGRGTSIQLRLPLSVAIIRLLLVECGGELVALPITRVLRTLELERAEIRSSGRQMVVPLGNELVPLLSLRRMLRQPAKPVAGTIPVVVSEARGRKIALVVDRLVGQREAFVKTLAFPLDRIAGVSGATILGDGRIVFIIDPQGLLDESAASGGRSGVSP
ncbi:MAG: chemotaxis protein CheA [Trichloromonas sp.]|jgi:two-component system chemotaxis sensor kinase CheA|nr:chemotaxis protein CheA [Trichloromonas sp.]